MFNVKQHCKINKSKNDIGQCLAALPATWALVLVGEGLYLSNKRNKQKSSKILLWCTQIPVLNSLFLPSTDWRGEGQRKVWRPSNRERIRSDSPPRNLQLFSLCCVCALVYVTQINKCFRSFKCVWLFSATPSIPSPITQRPKIKFHAQNNSETNCSVLCQKYYQHQINYMIT